MKRMCPICAGRPAEKDAAVAGWCDGCCGSWAALPFGVVGHDLAEWAARRARSSLLSTARKQTHAMNINVVGALVELRDAVLGAKPPGISLDDLRRLARRAKGKPIEPVAEVQKRARAAAKKRGGK